MAPHFCKVYSTLRWVTIKMEGSYPQWQLNVVQNVQGKFPPVVSNKMETYWDSIALGHITFNFIRSYHWKNVRRIFCLHGRLKFVWIFALRKGSDSGLRDPRNWEIRDIFACVENLWFWNPTKSGIQYLESWIHGVKSGVQYCLGLSIYMDSLTFVEN